MKKMIFAFSTAFLAASLSSASVVKTCTAHFSVPGQIPMTSDVEVYESKGELMADVTLTLEGEEGSATQTQPVKLHEGEVREGLNPEDEENYPVLNTSEMFILHALRLTTDPDLEGIFSTGFDLSLVRSAKVYQIGEMTKFGAAAIVEAQDADGNILGSFLGGFFVAPCQ